MSTKTLKTSTRTAKSALNASTDVGTVPADTLKGPSWSDQMDEHDADPVNKLTNENRILKQTVETLTAQVADFKERTQGLTESFCNNCGKKYFGGYRLCKSCREASALDSKNNDAPKQTVRTYDRTYDNKYDNNKNSRDNNDRGRSDRGRVRGDRGSRGRGDTVRESRPFKAADNFDEE